MESCVNLFYGILVQRLKKLMCNKHPGILKSWFRGVPALLVLTTEPKPLSFFVLFFKRTLLGGGHR